MKNKKWLVISLVLIVLMSICVCMVFAGWYFFLKPDGASSSSEPLEDHIVVELDSAPTSYLNDFPTSKIPYPPNWPKELTLPEEFVLVEAVFGNMPSNPNPAWGQKEVFDGSPTEAKETLLPFLIDQGWEVVQSYSYEPYGFVFVIEKSRGGSGIINIESDGENVEMSFLVITIIQPSSQD